MGPTKYRRGSGNVRSPVDPAKSVERDIKFEVIRRLAETLAGELKSLSMVPDRADNDQIHFYDEVAKFQMVLIEKALMMLGGSQTGAAQILHISISTLNSLIKRYNITWENYKGFKQDWSEPGEELKNGRARASAAPSRST